MPTEVVFGCYGKMFSNELLYNVNFLLGVERTFVFFFARACNCPETDYELTGFRTANRAVHTVKSVFGGVFGARYIGIGRVFLF